MDVKYCPKCATELVSRPSGDRARPTCPACGYVFYLNPVVGAGALVETDGRVVLVCRGAEPKAGYWSLPAGYVEADERAEEAAVREVREETGLEIEIDEMLGVYSFGREPQTGVLILYAAHLTGGELRAGDDACEVRAFAPDELPPDEQIAFRTHLQALQDWRRSRAIVYRQASGRDRSIVAEFSARYPQAGEQCSAYLDSESRDLLLALDRGQLVGIVCMSQRPWSHSASIDQLFVEPGYRRWGIATRLIGQAVALSAGRGLRTLLAEVPVANPAVLVYHKAGFRASGFLDAHYPPESDEPETALLLAYELAKGGPGAFPQHRDP